jgi:hypothetical protein
MMGIIFATDMSRHLADMKEINQLLAIDVNSEGGLKSLITSDDHQIREQTQLKLT